MEEKIKARLEMIEYEIQNHKKREDKLIEEVRTKAQGYDAYGIVNFLPNIIRDIRFERDEIAKLHEQKRLLIWVSKEND